MSKGRRLQSVVRVGNADDPDGDNEPPDTRCSSIDTSCCLEVCPVQEAYVAAVTFGGDRTGEGYVFRSGERGIGYYLDNPCVECRGRADFLSEINLLLAQRSVTEWRCEREAAPNADPPREFR